MHTYVFMNTQNTWQTSFEALKENIKVLFDIDWGERKETSDDLQSSHMVKILIVFPFLVFGCFHGRGLVGPLYWKHSNEDRFSSHHLALSNHVHTELQLFPCWAPKPCLLSVSWDCFLVFVPLLISCNNHKAQYPWNKSLSQISFRWTPNTILHSKFKK